MCGGLKSPIGVGKKAPQKGSSRPVLLDHRSLAPVGPGAGLRPAQKERKGAEKRFKGRTALKRAASILSGNLRPQGRATLARGRQSGAP